MPPTIEGYKTLKKIGEGGFSEIFRAVDAKGVNVVVKLLSPRHRNNPAARKALQREGWIGQRVDSHPHVVRTYSAGECADGPYVVIEYCEGSTLRQQIRQGPLKEAQVIRIAREMGEAVMHLHARRILHLDIKPENIFLSPSGAKLIDFGLARQQNLLSFLSKPTVSGSPSYIAPERLLGNQVDQRADIYSLGITLYEALAGRPPYVGLSTKELIIKHISRDQTPTPVRQAAPGTSQALASVIERSIETSPDARLANISEFLLGLRRTESTLSPVLLTGSKETPTGPEAPLQQQKPEEEDGQSELEEISSIEGLPSRPPEPQAGDREIVVEEPADAEPLPSLEDPEREHETGHDQQTPEEPAGAEPPPSLEGTEREREAGHNQQVPEEPAAGEPPPSLEDPEREREAGHDQQVPEEPAAGEPPPSPEAPKREHKKERKRKPRKEPRVKRGRGRAPAKPVGTRFRWRLFAGVLGAAAALAAQGLFYREELLAQWKVLTAGVEGKLWIQYLAMGGMLFGAVLACGLVTGLMDRSAIRSFFLGAGWSALLVVCMLIGRAANPEALDGWPRAARMAESAVNPIYIHHVRNHEQEKSGWEQSRKELEEKLGVRKSAEETALGEAEKLKREIARHKEEFPDKLKSAEQRSRDEEAAKWRSVTEKKDQELEKLRQSLQEALKKLEAEAAPAPAQPEAAPKETPVPEQ